MKVKEVKAKSLLTKVGSPENWFGNVYNMNIYRGCQHGCIYCDSRSQCYHVENFDDEIIVKSNVLELLKKELSSKRVVGTIGTGAMSDPYIPLEKKYNLTGEALKIIEYYKFPVTIITKSSLILKDIETLKGINKSTQATVGITITTIDEKLARIIEPKAPSPLERLEALKKLSMEGIYTGVLMMPILPYINDSEDNIRTIIEASNRAGAKFIIPMFGVTLRDAQRVYFYNKLEGNFKDLKERYAKEYGENYVCMSKNTKKLWNLTKRLCGEYDMVSHMRDLKIYKADEYVQTSLF
ncbi:SPL family radical SAM protein [Clostridium sp. 'White wine YQ']|uniref:SPL family radical SAM protein n=1 Tax=Clostridium sp. 'White wine YQ' TaxID=3027474 RepID=UPI002366C26A|nr:radical SAM protein [Clostridium sp. 'White wine YQ']MDD7793314.1 radical SAM protein [Clostridium sp. 'White wine YQ']